MRNFSEIRAFEDEFELFELPASRLIGLEVRNGGALGNTAPRFGARHLKAARWTR